MASPSSDTGTTPRLVKVLAQAGVASRRDVDALIAAGKVLVNGIPAVPGQRYEEGSVVFVNGMLVSVGNTPPLQLYRFHKPRNTLVTNHDPQGRPTIFSLLPPDMPRLVSVGRLDFTSEGLLLLTTSGALARHLELPSTGWARRYRVRVHGMVDADRLKRLAEGVTLEGVHYGSIEATLDRQQGHNAWLTMILREGKNREIRKVMEALGYPVTRLIRTAYGGFQLGNLPDAAIEQVPMPHLRQQLGQRMLQKLQEGR